MEKFDLEDRLIAFAVDAIKISENMPNSFAGVHLANQLVRSSTSPALNYGEAQSAESRRDFIHKLKVVAKELRETFVNLKIIVRSNLYKADASLILKENNELISIIVSSIKTAQKNQAADRKNRKILIAKGIKNFNTNM